MHLTSMPPAPVRTAPLEFEATTRGEQHNTSEHTYRHTQGEKRNGSDAWDDVGQQRTWTCIRSNQFRDERGNSGIDHSFIHRTSFHTHAASHSSYRTRRVEYRMLCSVESSDRAASVNPSVTARSAAIASLLCRPLSFAVCTLSCSSSSASHPLTRLDSSPLSSDTHCRQQPTTRTRHDDKRRNAVLMWCNAMILFDRRVAADYRAHSFVGTSITLHLHASLRTATHAEMSLSSSFLTLIVDTDDEQKFLFSASLMSERHRRGGAAMTTLSSRLSSDVRYTNGFILPHTTTIPIGHNTHLMMMRSGATTHLKFISTHILLCTAIQQHSSRSFIFHSPFFFPLHSSPSFLMSSPLPPLPPFSSSSSTPLRAPPNLLASQLSKLRPHALLYSLGALFVPLCCAALFVALLAHSALLCSIADLLYVWTNHFLYHLIWKRGSMHSKLAANYALSSYHLPLLQALVTLRCVVQCSISRLCPHGSAKKNRAVAGLNIVYAAMVWGGFNEVATEAAAAVANDFAPNGSVTPSTLFLSFYNSTLLFSALSLVSIVWVPTSENKLKEAEAALIDSFLKSLSSSPSSSSSASSSSSSSSSSSPPAIKQHYHAHHSYLLLQNGTDKADIGSASDGAAEKPTEKKPNASIPRSIDSSAPSSASASVVFLHGFGGGKSLFLPNLVPLSLQFPHRRFYSLDLMGAGQSSSLFSLRHARTYQGAEAYFVQHLEMWRRSLGIEKMILMGNGVGAMVAACYAMRYEERVERLVLVAPVGMETPDSATESAKNTAANAAASASSASSSSSSSAAAIVPPASPPSPLRRFLLLPLFSLFWSLGFSLSDVLHLLGPLGKVFFCYALRVKLGQLMQGKEKQKNRERNCDGIQQFSMEDSEASSSASSASTSSSSSSSPLDLSALSLYIYHLNSGSCVSHRSLNLLFLPSFFSCAPLRPRLVESLHVDLTFIYGVQEWTAVKEGQRVVNELDARSAENESNTAEESKAGEATALTATAQKKKPVKAECVVVAEAGQQVHLENVEGFNRAMERIIRGVEEKEKKQKQQKQTTTLSLATETTSEQKASAAPSTDAAADDDDGDQSSSSSSSSTVGLQQRGKKKPAPASS